jgi:hypothetical protein
MPKAPIVLAITGHRDILPKDVEALTNKISHIITTLKKKYKYTPITFLSPLADGADRIGAEVAIQNGCELIVPLPMPIEEYKKDFDKISKAQFDRLLKQASQSFVIPCHQSENRDNYYIAIGDFISTHAHILIALWDGVESNKPGGTGYVVAKKIKGVDEHNGLSLPDVSQIIHIATPRISNPEIEKPFSSKMIYPTIENNQEEATVIFNTMLKNIDEYNSDTLNHKIQKDSYYFPSIQDDPDYEKINAIFYTADTLAKVNQTHYKYTLKTSLLLTIAALICFELGTGVSDLAYMMWGYIFFLTVIILLKHIPYFIKLQQKYLDYRALSEAIRTQTAWNIAGVQEQVNIHYLRKQHDEIHWIRKYLQYISMQHRMPIKPFSDAIEEWVNDQIHYFKSAQAKKEKVYEYLKKVTFCLYVIGIVTIIIFTYNFPDLLGLFAPLFATPVAISLSITAYIQLTALEQEIRQYQRTHKIFSQAYKVIKSSDNQSIKNILFELGKESLRENGDWLMLHRERKLEDKI